MPPPPHPAGSSGNLPQKHPARSSQSGDGSDFVTARLGTASASANRIKEKDQPRVNASGVITARLPGVYASAKKCKLEGYSQVDNAELVTARPVISLTAMEAKRNPKSNPCPKTPSRRFIPEDIYPSPFKASDIEREIGHWVFVACPGRTKCRNYKRHSSHLDTIVVAVDGACIGNGQEDAVSSLAVYVGPWNHNNVVDDKGIYPGQTSQIAEMEAAIWAVSTVSGIEEDFDSDDDSDEIWLCGRPRTVIIKSDSSYVVRGLTEHLPKWKANGWRNSSGKRVANREKWEELEEVVCEAEDQGFEIFFWHVPREMNRIADAAANWALSPRTTCRFAGVEWRGGRARIIPLIGF
ncbi:uncharacterized protein DSM5745_02711 [Aspergillus mulundensis]|uniref:ribonuclease H n=1 Tax=Aspergillus mulundensis TaxID=1810919 RepID=A0A3D8SIB2_9EURO|nr:hypothetical protein DSM5745_02711 [Aspergillus mulundensis]RDW86069.1 hypothetical protein DSM5745_02711 [Aspergillus mulundensis]